MTPLPDSSPVDLSRLRIDRAAPARRRWVPVVALLGLAALGAAVYPSARAYLEVRRAPEVDVARVTQAADSPGGSTRLPVLVATGYVVARKSSDVGVKVGGRIQALDFEEGTWVRIGQVIARLEHADLDAQLAAALAAVAESETQLAQTRATRDEDLRHLERQRALFHDGITTTAALTAADATAQVSASRVETAAAVITSARARVHVIEQAIENTNVRAPFDGVVIRKRAEIGETVSPFGVAGQGTREGGAIATIADLREREVQAEVSENNVAKLRRGMPASVKLQAYPERTFTGRVREIFPSADRAKAIIEVRVSILNPDEDVKPEMTASVTFEEPSAKAPAATGPGVARSVPPVLVPKRAVTERGGQTAVWVVIGGTASKRVVTLGAERIDQVEVRSGVAPGEAVILNPPEGLPDRGLVRIKGQ